MSEIALFQTFLITFTVNTTTETIILLFSFICQDINSIVLQISQIGFSRQELSNEHMMGFVRQFRIFDLYIGFADLLGADGDQKSKESRHLWSTCFWHDSSLVFACQPARPKKVIFFRGTP